MNTVTELINNLANLWADQMWMIIWQSSVLSAIILLVSLCFRRLSSVVKFWLWMLVPLRLLLMPIITISLPLLPAIAPEQTEIPQTEPAIIETIAAEPFTFTTDNFPLSEEVYDFEPILSQPVELPEVDVAAMHIRPSIWSVFLSIWLAGVALWIARLFWGWRKIRNIIRSADVLSRERALELAYNAADSVGLKKVPKILVTKENISPFLFGVFRPVLIVPAGFVKNVSNEGFYAVFAHEFAHLRRKDTIVGWILAVCEVFYFFHPVLHFAKRRILFERERACDDWVLVLGNAPKKSYANALINAAGICKDFSARLGPTGAVAESFGDLKKRIIAIGSNLKPKTRLSKTALTMLILIGAICVPGFVLTNRTIASNEKATLETIREMVAHNEALINPIKMQYTVKKSREGERPVSMTSGGRRPGRSFSHSEHIWAQDGEKHFAQTDYFYGPNEPASSNVYILDDQITKSGKMPDLMEGAINRRDTFDWYNVMIAKLGLRPFEGEHSLSEILVSDYATLYNKTEIVSNRETFVVDVRRPSYPTYFARIWIDKQRGMPLRIWYYRKHPAWGDQETMSEINDIELHQLPNGSWLPFKGTRSIDHTNYISYEHITVDIDSIKTGREDIPQSLFQIDFPDGARIYNVITGLKYFNGQSIKTYEQVLKDDGNFIAGTVVDINGVAVSDVVVRPSVLRTPSSGYSILNDINGTVTDSKGRFAVELEQEGSYELLFYPNDFIDTRVGYIPLGEHNLKVTLEKGGRVTGKVVRFENGKKVPVVNTEVTANAERLTMVRSDRLKALTDSQGRFEIKYLSTHLSPQNAEDTQYRPQPWDISCGPVTESIIFEEGKNVQEVKIILRPDLENAIPLTGKSLPSLEGIKIDFDINQVKDKKLLICFFDLEERPARNGILQLNKRIQELEEKGIETIAIHASKIEQNELDEWLKENNVSLSVGIIEDNEEQTRFNWAIRSLPWMILTDTEHAVIDEGFGIDELDEKINESAEVNTLGTITTPQLLLSTKNNNLLVRGVVTDRNGKTIAGAKIYIYHSISNWDFENRIDQQVTSSNDGSFRFEKTLQYRNPNEFPNGNDKFILIATHPDYALGWSHIVKDQEKESYELVLTEPQSQTITVTDHQGNPLAGVRVWPYIIGNSADPEQLFTEKLLMRSDVGITGGITGADGRAVIENLPRTEFYFNTKLKGYAIGFALPGQTRIRLSKGAAVRGSVLDEEGKPVGNALVKFKANWNFSQSFLTKTDSQGKFSLEDLPAEGWDRSPWGSSESATGSYVITIEHNDYITSVTQDVLEPGDIKENFIIDAYHGTLIKCNVVEKGTGRPIAGARIQGMNESGSIDGYTDADGVFTCRVFPGSVSLSMASPPEGTYVLRDSSLPSSSQLDAKGKEMTFTLEVPKIAGLLTTVHGKVLLPDGSPAANLEINTATSAYYEAQGYNGHGGARTTTKSDGTFVLENVPDGLKLFIYGSTKDFNYILAETIDDLKNPTELSVPLVMKPGQTADVLLTDGQGNPRANVPLKILPKAWGNLISRADEHYGRTDEKGYLKIDGVIPGMEYFIMDSKGDLGDSEWQQYYNETRILIPEMSESEQQTSLAWYILRQWNVGPLLLGLSQRLGKVVESSQQNDTVWTGVDNGGSLKLDITVEDDVTGDIYIGFFDDPKWSSEPVQVRKFSGPGQYIIENLPEGTYQIGAMLGSLPVPIALGVQRAWPEAVEIKSGRETATQVLLSIEFQKHTSGWYNNEVSRDFVGDWKDMNPDTLLQGKATGPDGHPIAFATVQIREHNPGARSIMAPNRGTDEQGFYKFDEIEWPYRVGVIWQDNMPSVFGYRHQYMYFNSVLEGPHTIDFKFDPFPTGNANVEGRVLDQDGNPLKEFSIDVRTKMDWDVRDNPDDKYYKVIGYRKAFLSDDGSFRLENLPAGESTIDVIPFDIQAYESHRGKDILLEEGHTTNYDLKVVSKNIFYGRVLFPDGSAAVIKPEPWPGAKTSIIMFMGPMGKGVGQVDDTGYFTVKLSEEEIQRLKSGENQLQINTPSSEEGHSRNMGIFPFEELSTDKNQAGIIEIDWPERPRKSLANNLLPVFEGIKSNFDIEQVKDMPILVCFWDLEQRPSRNMIIQLSKRIQELEEKGIKTIAIHATKIEVESLNDWMKENNISIPIGIVEADEQQIRFNWAIQSLPWLILTDTEHIVTDEGFGIDELDEKLNGLAITNYMLPENAQLLDVLGNEIAGYVEDKNGNPVISASIELVNKELLLLPEPVKVGDEILKTISQYYWTQSMKDGYFSISDLNHGKTDILIKAENYQTKIVNDIPTGTNDLKIILDEPETYRLSGKVTDR